MNLTEQRVPAAGIVRLTVEIHHGDVSIRWREGDDIGVRGEDVEVSKRGDELLVERRGHGRFSTREPVSIDVPASLAACTLDLRHGDLRLAQPRGRLKAHLGHGDVELRAGVAEVELRAGHGDVSIEGLTGALSLTSGAGDVRLSAIWGPITARTGHGDIRVDGGSGMLDVMTGAGDVAVHDREVAMLAIKTGRGDVALVGGTSQRTAVQTGAGDVRCALALGPGAHDFQTGSGDLVIEVPRDLSARIEATTTLGSIRSDLPLVSVGQRGPKSLFGRRLVGSIGEGAERAEVLLRTQRGDVRIAWLDEAAMHARQAAASPDIEEAGLREDQPAYEQRSAGPATAPAPTSLEAEQRAILEAVAAGTLSIQEAEQLLDVLGECR